MSNSEKPAPVTTQEEKEVHRVFEQLCDFQERTRIKTEISDLENWAAAHRNRSFIDSQSEASLQANQLRIDELKGQLQMLDLKPEKLISCGDVMEMFKWLKQKTTKKEVEEMIWEVDENLDGCLDWTEFRLMYNRNIMDRTGLEPSRMVRLLQNAFPLLLCTLCLS